ncbi:MAG: peptidase and matrixin and adamalysin [Caulobacteraceae bacterium]|nr:peptidase and matrixin and adamalysin [Caulobacteraceae bacterium]
MTDTMVPNGGYAVAGATTARSGAAAMALSAGGSIDDAYISYGAVTSVNLNPVSDLLTVYSRGGASSAVQLSGNLQSATLALSDDGIGGTEIVDLGVSPQGQVNDPLFPVQSSHQTIILAGSNLQFVNNYTSRVGQGYLNAVVTAETFYESQVANTATLNFTFDMNPSVGPGINDFSFVSASFSQLQTALAGAATSADDKAAVGAIGGLASQFAGSTFQIAQPLAQILGLPGASGYTFDSVQLDSTLNYFFSQANPVPGAYDAVAILEHEISEGGFGRVGGDGSSNGIMDIFRYAAAGVPDPSLGRDGKSAYFSINGTQLLTQFHDPVATNGSNDGADSADWDASGANQQPTYIPGQPNQYDAYGVTLGGAVGVVTATDLRVLDVLGWTLSAMAPITTVSSGQTVTVAAGQVDSGVTVQSGGVLDVASGGTAQATVVSGGLEFVLTGGLDTGATLEAGGEQVVSSGAAASAVTVQSGGFQLVRSGGFSSGTTVLSGGLERFYSGGSASNLVLSSGATLGTEAMIAGGTSAAVTSTTATSTTVVSGVTVMSGGIIEIQAATVDSGGFLALPAGGDLPGLTTVSSGGTLSGPGSADGNVFDYGVMDGVVISGSSTASKGYAYIEAGGVASGLVVVGGGVVDVLSGGVASATTVQSGGALIVESGASVGGSNLLPGGTIDLAGIVATSAFINASGQLVATSGGTTVDTIGLGAATNPGLTFAVASDGAGGTNLTARTAVADFNADGLSDLVWRNANGDAGIWLTGAGGGYTPVDFGVIDNSWQIQAVGDFNGDGKADILWRNSNGAVGEWLSAPGAGYTGFTMPILASIDPSWTIQGVGDFNGDGLSDLVWRNTNGDAGIWLTTAGGGYTPIDFGIIDNNWTIQGVGDFNGDGKADLLWRNAATGQVGEWLSNTGAGYAGFTAPILATIDPSWKIQGVGDFNGDGLSDILWRNTNGDTGVWMTTAGGGYAPVDLGVVDSSWTVQGVGDFNGDGKADILWRNSNGAVGEWLSKSGSGFTAPILAAVDPSWVIQGNPPALQGGGMSAAPLAQAMASIGEGGGGVSTAAATSAPPPLIASLAVTRALGLTATP